MSNNITTVPMLPDAEGVGTEDTLYLIQGTGSDRDRKATLAAILECLQKNFGAVECKGLTVKEGGTLSLTYYDSQAGDVTLTVKQYANQNVKTFRVAISGSKSALRIAQNLLLESGLAVEGDAEVSGTLKAKTIEGTNAGTSGTYLIINNLTVSGDLDAKGNAWFGNGLLRADYDSQKVEVNGDAEVSGTLTTRAVTASGKVAINSAASVSGQLDVSGPANLKGGANVADLKITGSVQFPSGNGLIPTLVYNVDNSRGDILSNYVGTDRNVFILLVNADSAVHTIQYTSQEASGASERYKQIAVAEAGLFYIDSSGNAAPVS